MRDLDDVEAEARRVRLHDLAHLRVQRLREHDLAAVGDVPSDEARVGGDRAAVVARRVGDVHPRQLADHGLVLEDRLQRSLAHLRLVRRVRGQELAAGEHDVGDGGHVVVVDAGADERQLRAGVDVLRREFLEVAHELRLAERGRNVELAVEANTRRDLLEQLVDRRDADRREHLRAVGVGQAQIAHSPTARRRARGTRPRPSARRARTRRTCGSG